MFPCRNTDGYPNIERCSTPGSASVARANAATVCSVGFVNAGIFRGACPGVDGFRGGMIFNLFTDGPPRELVGEPTLCLRKAMPLLARQLHSASGMDLTQRFLDRSCFYLQTEYRIKLRVSVEALPPNALWWRANEQSNSIGNL